MQMRYVCVCVCVYTRAVRSSSKELHTEISVQFEMNTLMHDIIPYNWNQLKATQ